jgi:hypothetical protein
VNRRTKTTGLVAHTTAERNAPYLSRRSPSCFISVLSMRSTASSDGESISSMWREAVACTIARRRTCPGRLYTEAVPLSESEAV